MINIGSMFIGKRNIFSRDIAVKALLASSTPPLSVYVTNVATVTYRNDILKEPVASRKIQICVLSQMSCIGKFSVDVVKLHINLNKKKDLFL